MSYLMAADVVAHLERNGDIVLTSYGKAILFMLFAIVGLCSIGIIIAVGDVAKKVGR